MIWPNSLAIVTVPLVGAFSTPARPVVIGRI